jgi:hypothetical protein
VDFELTEGMALKHIGEHVLGLPRSRPGAWLQTDEHERGRD